MKFSLKTLAAAVALATVAAGANATMSTAVSSTNGSLVLVAYSATSGYTTGAFDLGLTIDQIIPAAGSVNTAFTTGLPGDEIVWNFKTNSVGGTYGSSAAYVGATTGVWSTQYADWMADMNGATDIRYAVIAASKETASDSRALSTSSALIGKVDDTLKSNLSSFGATYDAFIAPHNNIGSHVGNLDGGSSSLDSSSSFAKANTAFSTSMNWKGLASFDMTAASGTAMSFYALDRTVSTAQTTARVIQFGNEAGAATFNFDAAAGTLTYAVPVPEPESYAMLLAGLGMLAAVARRRRAN